MKNTILISLVFVIVSSLKAQSNIDSLRYELSYYKSGEKYGDKIALARIVHDKLPFDHLSIDYICRYYYNRDIDSVSIFLDKIIEAYPDSIKSYILKADNIYFIQNINHIQQKAECLKQAYKKDSFNLKVNYMLAELYYQDFLKPYYRYKSLSLEVLKDETEETEILPPVIVEKSYFIKPEDEALFYFNNLIKIDPELKKIMFFPIQQIERYKDKEWIAQDPTSVDNDCYFPIWYFLDLEKDWEGDLTRNYLFDLEMSPSKGLSYFLELIDEPCLYNCSITDALEVFRFTWLRTFDNPICLRVENVGDKYILYWKLLDGKGGYGYGELKIQKSKEISTVEWDTFKELFEIVKLSDLPNSKSYDILDGASWTLEYKNEDHFKAHKTNSPSKEIVKCCTYLLNLTDLEINEGRIY